MKRWFFVFSLFLALIYFLTKNHQDLGQIPPASSPALKTSLPLLNDPLPSQDTVKIKPRLPSSRLSLRERIDPQVALKIGSKSYLLDDERVALSLDRALALKVPVQKKMGAWAIVSLSDLPLDEPSYPVLKREGSGNLGVFRGILRAMSFEPLPENAASEACPARVFESFPEIKVYLFELSGSARLDELKECLEATRLFSRLEWEVLDRPRYNR